MLKQVVHIITTIFKTVLMNLLPPSSKFVWSKNSNHISKWICFYIRRCDCSSGGSLQQVGTVVEETGVMWQVWKGCGEVSRCNGYVLREVMVWDVVIKWS
jgi:hypothetical protein